ncbi:Hypothetical protein LUCI_3813 [Lucifera butyrica]|uniref:Uncharacterized protein n=1 Tax=Lucifera butyrica TaxID=1351585 RepID=A0A498RC17_9FIRM|nr:Hypothetical protein LUCI_3813 [Lucifera butyrica]
MSWVEQTAWNNFAPRILDNQTKIKDICTSALICKIWQEFCFLWEIKVCCRRFEMNGNGHTDVTPINVLNYYHLLDPIIWSLLVANSTKRLFFQYE